MIILGVDPGIAITGFGVVRVEHNRHIALGYGAIRTPAKETTARRLEAIYRELTQLITEFRPDCFAIEELFFNKNSATALIVGQARGVAILAGSHAGLPVFEYTPLQVKTAVTGYGRAGKQQVAYMVRMLLGLESTPEPDDVTDALAVCICHGFNANNWGRRGE
ncbi:MAG: crossover junction endodeoxyribonuclease RuvC [Limnochordia bacterium]|nr:crossover junction endodeoxyribonuclease RuvC [Bacillota bacterium]NLL07685.1 crossover junction endodeoxyribonuclease RuvC [Bacillota bacterium]HBG08470.1 crossover junction endodeoxyribonuclease RuvC [Bacillota bacterium]